MVFRRLLLSSVYSCLICGILKRSAYEHNSTHVIVFRSYVIRLS